MKGSLEDYQSMRDFARTPEPSGGEVPEVPFFVVQEHHASHFHHDFRLLLDDVLKSWAVPKGMPEKPKVKRLAVQTEDHPVAYGSFEGVIPEGEYGAGTVSIWDRGEFVLEEREEGKIVVELKGRKLTGTYALIKFKGKEKDENNWLVMRTH